MSRYTRLPRARVKKRDEFISFMDHATYVVSQYKGLTLSIAIVLVVVILGVIWKQNHTEKKRIALAQSIYEAVKSPDPVAALSLLKEKTDASSAWQIQTSILEKQKEKKDPAYLDTIQKISGAPSDFYSLILFSQTQALWQQGKVDEALKLLESGQAEMFSEELALLKKELLTHEK